MLGLRSHQVAGRRYHGDEKRRLAADDGYDGESRLMGASKRAAIADRTSKPSGTPGSPHVEDDVESLVDAYHAHRAGRLFIEHHGSSASW